MAHITYELKATLEENPQIKNVHFDMEGNHHFNVFPASATITDPVTGAKKVVSAPGLMAGGKGGSIVKTMTRDEVMNGVTVEAPSKEKKDKNNK
jgi:hypothetical protein